MRLLSTPRRGKGADFVWTEGAVMDGYRINQAIPPTLATSESADIIAAYKKIVVVGCQGYCRSFMYQYAVEVKP
jgi:hypothetical protein